MIKYIKILIHRTFNYCIFIIILLNCCQKKLSIQDKEELCDYYLKHGKYQDALSIINEVIKTYKILIENEENNEYLINIANSINKKAEILNILGEHDKSIEEYDKSIDIYNKLLERNYQNVILNKLAECLERKGYELSNIKKYNDALDVFNRVINIYKNLIDKEESLETDKKLADCIRYRNYIYNFIENDSRTSEDKLNEYNFIQKVYDRINKYNGDSNTFEILTNNLCQRAYLYYKLSKNKESLVDFEKALENYKILHDRTKNIDYKRQTEKIQKYIQKIKL